MAALKVRDRYLASQDIAVKYPSDIDANGYFIGHPETDVNQVIGLARQNSTAYTAGSIAFSTALPSGLVIECTTPGTTAATEPSYSGAAEGGTVNDGTAVWTYKKLLSSGGSAGGGGVPLAAIIPWVDDVNTVPAGFLKCDGTAVSRTDYADLFGAIGTKYGSGDGSTTFNKPDLTDAAIMNGTYDKTTFTTAGSTTFTAPKDGYYKITVKGAGGGGGGTAAGSGGGGGGEGGTTFSYEYINAGNTATVVIGAGGTGGAVNISGTDGGDSSVVVNANTYTGGGGKGGKSSSSNSDTGYGGAGGSGTINGVAGGSTYEAAHASDCASAGGNGGGNGGGVGSSNSYSNGVLGGGGSGGGMRYGTYTGSGGKGGDGYVWIEYIGTASQYLIKYTPTVIDSEVSAATSASQAQAAAQAAESYAGSAGIPVGTLFPYAADTQTPPTGFLFCNGQAVSRTMYADLFSVLGTTWGAGDGSTTFNLPTSEDLVLQGASTTNPVGTYLQAGLPNIEGKISGSSSNAGFIRTASSSMPNNAFTFDGATSNIFGQGGTVSDGAITANFDASQSNAIYGNSDTVQSPAACVKFIIKAYDGVTPGSAGIDLSQYAADLANKATRSLDNLTATGEDHFLENDFAIIYPNGGTEANPANVTINSRYVESNPFPGYICECKAEIYVDGAWGEYPFETISNSTALGLTAFYFEDSIILQTANSYLYSTPPAWIATPLSISAAGASAPCRIKVYKIGKVANNA